MEAILETVIVVFMLFLCALCLFAVLVIVRDIITESAARRRKNEGKDTVVNQTPAPAPVQAAPTPVVLVQAPAAVPAEPMVVVQAPAPARAVEEEEPIAEPAPAAEEAEKPEPTPQAVVSAVEEDDPNAVKFSTSHVMTLSEKYAALSSEYKGYFDEICRYAAAKEGAKEFRNNSYCDYKQGTQRLVRITIKRGEIFCQFVFIDRDFKSYASQNNVKMKASATTVKVVEPVAVGVVKDGIDLVCQQIAEEREFKKQQALARRRAKRAAKKGEVTDA